VTLRLPRDRPKRLSHRTTGVLGRLRRWWFLHRTDQAYARLRSDPQAWAEELEERRFWDAVVASRPDAEGW